VRSYCSARWLNLLASVAPALGGFRDASTRAARRHPGRRAGIQRVILADILSQLVPAGPRVVGSVEKAPKSVIARSDVFGATSQSRFRHTIRSEIATPFGLAMTKTDVFQQSPMPGVTTWVFVAHSLLWVPRYITPHKFPTNSPSFPASRPLLMNTVGYSQRRKE
jgi:hypothetical protein